MELKTKKNFLYYLLFYPQDLIGYLLKKKEIEFFPFSFLLFLLSVFSNVLGSGIFRLDPDQVFGWLGFKFIFYLADWLGNLLIFLALIYFFKWLFHPDKTAAFKYNPVQMLLKLFCLTYFPLLFMPAAGILALALKSWFNLNFFILFQLILYYWVLYLQITVIRNYFQLKSGTAIIVYFTPLLFMGIMLFTKFINLVSKLLSIIV